MFSLSNKEIRALKARAQLLRPILKVGRQGLSAEFITAMHEVLKHHDLIKIKFDEFKEERKQLAPKMAEQTGSQFIWMVGHVAVFYRPLPHKDSSTAPDAKAPSPASQRKEH